MKELRRFREKASQTAAAKEAKKQAQLRAKEERDRMALENGDNALLALKFRQNADESILGASEKREAARRAQLEAAQSKAEAEGLGAAAKDAEDAAFEARQQAIPRPPGCLLACLLACL